MKRERRSQPTLWGTMALRRCLFCSKRLARDADDNGFPRVRATAYDVEKGRLWAICDHCRRWNLWPIEDRAEVIDAMERLAHDRGIAIASTDNITLLRAEDVGLVRVGRASLAERSWWRYGRELHRRKLWHDTRVSRVSAYVYGALAYAGESVGLADVGQKIRWDEAGLTDILRWRRFGWAAWRGRLDCPNCGSVRRALLYNNSAWIYPVASPEGLALSVPCPRCDFWDPETGYRLEGEEAETTLRRVLACRHIRGASQDVVEAASDAIEDEGSTEGFIHRVADEATSLWRMDPVRSIGLEIAVNEAAERRVLAGLAKELEFVWKREEELAGIIDRELT